MIGPLVDLEDIFVEHVGPSGGPTIVLVHGAPDRATTFRNVVALLPDYRIVLYDRRGYGRSVAAKRAESMHDHAADLIGILATLTAPRFVVAHSFGGNPAMLAVTQCPGLFAAVGLWEPPLVWSDLWPQSVRDYNAAVVASPDPGSAIEAVYRRLLGDRWEHLSPADRAERLAEGPAFQVDMASGLRPQVALDDVRVPTIVGYGTETRASHIAGARWLADRLPNASTHVIPGAGHFACRTHPREYAGFVRSVAELAST